MTELLTPLPVHEIANMMPEMTDEERQALTEDIKANGQLMPIITLDGAIIDGRHRYWACMELGIEPRTQEWQGSRDTDVIIQSMIAMNVVRRHLTASQRAVLSVNFLPYYEGKARERQATSTGGSEPQLKTKLSEADDPNDQGQARDQVAALFKVSPAYVSAAKRISNWNPEVADAVARGDISLMDAGRMMKDATPPSDDTTPDAPDTHQEPAIRAPESISETQPIRIPNPTHNWRENVTYTARYSRGEWSIAEA